MSKEPSIYDYIDDEYPEGFMMKFKEGWYRYSDGKWNQI